MSSFAAMDIANIPYRYITVEGNIGAGKTTLATLLADRLYSRLILEEFADNPFLPRFYENPQQYAFPLELFFMAERYKQLTENPLTPDLFGSFTVSDYLFTKCLLFARVNLQEEEYRLFMRLFEIMNQQIVLPDIVIYLHAPVRKLQQNIQKRNRAYELNIPDQYLYDIQETYQHFIRTNPVPTLLIDVSDADFLNNPHQLNTVIESLGQSYEPGTHVINLQ